MTTVAKPRKRGRPTRAVTPPCARCGELGGRIHSKGTTPERLDGTPFGHPGKHCRKCYEHLRNISLKANGKGHRKAESPPPKPQPVAAATPCSDCGTTGGRVRPDGSRSPARLNGEAVGMSGLLCVRCYNRAYERRRREAARRMAEDCRDDVDILHHVRLEKFRGYPLPVLTPPFHRDDLTPKAESRLLIRESRKGGRL